MAKTLADRRVERIVNPGPDQVSVLYPIVVYDDKGNRFLQISNEAGTERAPGFPEVERCELVTFNRACVWPEKGFVHLSPFFKELEGLYRMEKIEQ